MRCCATGLKFDSTSYKWLVIAGPKAQFKGLGTINGSGNYGFMLTALDADLTPSVDTDLFRIKIWDRDDNNTIVYDNQMDAPDDAELDHPTPGRQHRRSRKKEEVAGSIHTAAKAALGGQPSPSTIPA